MCYYRAGLWAETQGKEIHLVLLYRIGYWVRMSNLYATANKVNVNQRNMQFAVSISCIGAMFSTKRYRYIFASIALIIIGISFSL